MRVAAQIDVNAPADAVWAFVDDPGRYLHFMSGITRWEVVGEQPSGLGARYRMLMHVGSAEVGGLVEVVEHDPGCDMAWVSVVGIDQRGRWRLREHAGTGRTRVLTPPGLGLGIDENTAIVRLFLAFAASIIAAYEPAM